MGINIYLKNLKYLGFSYLVIFILAVPLITLFYYGSAYSNQVENITKFAFKFPYEMANWFTGLGLDYAQCKIEPKGL